LATDCIITGGGVIGLLVARELSRAGQSVVILERGEIGRESSWAGGGILSPLYPWQTSAPVEALVRWSQDCFPVLTEELRIGTGIDSEWVRSGLLIFDTEHRDEALEWALRTGAAVEIVEPRYLKEIEPQAAEASSAVLWLPQVAQVRNPRLLRALRVFLEKAGVLIIEHAEVLSVLSGDSRVTGVKTSKGDFSADKVVVASGAWTGQLLKPFPLKRAITPVRGQILLVQTPSGFLRRILLKQDCYLVPRLDGRVLVGSTVEHVGFDKSITKEANTSLLTWARHIVPALTEYPVERQWAGLRPHSASGVPYIGPHPELEGLFVNAGHFRNGVAAGPASARLLADLMVEREPILPPGPYSPER